MFLENGTLRKRNSWKKELLIVIEMIKSFGTIGTELTMTAFNKAGKITHGRRGGSSS